MIKALVSDFSRVLLFPVDKNYTEGNLNILHRTLSEQGAYDFWSYFRLNTELLDFYKGIAKTLPVYMFTTDIIQEHPALQEHLHGVFREVFSANRLGKKKSESSSYAWIAEHIGVPVEQVLYIDDLASHVDAARKASMMSIRYTSNEMVIPQIKAAIT